MVEARGWRVPLYLGGGLAALAVIGVILAIVALSNHNDVVADESDADAVGLGGAAGRDADAAAGDDHAAAEHDAGPERDADRRPERDRRRRTRTRARRPSHGDRDAEPTATEDPTGTGTGSTFPGWTGATATTRSSSSRRTSQSGAEKVAQKAQDAGLSDVGILDSGDYSSLNGGY